MLLQWCNLTPFGTSKLTAIRFASPCRVQSVRIFPTGTRPFVAAPDIIARTEPEAFFMDVYFNAHPLQPGSQADGKPKLKVPNALIPTVIPYAGGQAEFAVNMGADFATRLMIVRGDFETVSMAIYGEPVSEVYPAITSYEARPLPVLEPTPVSPALDLARSSDPTHLARQLLALIPDAPPLNLVIRLMFCLKPPNDDWDLPEFPHLYSDLHEEDVDIDLDSAYRCLSRPVADDVSLEALLRFAEKVADAISPTDNTRSYFMAEILCRSASQHRDLARMLVQTIDLERVFDTSSVDEDMVFTLLDASTNPDIAKLLDDDWFRSALDSVYSMPATEPDVKKGIRRLSNRLRDWQLFEDTLSNPNGNFVAAARFLKDIGSEEKSFGIWLSCMTTHEDLFASLQGGPTFDCSVPGSLWDSELANASHADYIGFVKAFIGVACVLAVYAWSDSLPNVSCRERTLGVLRLWQDVPGYREIVNHLLLLRQMTFRLECMTMDNDPPDMSGIHAENIILNLVNEPRCYLSPHFVKCIRSWQPFTLTYISEEERQSLENAAAVAEDGPSSAIEELARSNSGPLNMDRVRVLRVAVGIIQHHVDEESAGDLEVLQTGWKENVYGLFFRSVDLAFEVGQELKNQLALSVPPPVEKGLLEQYLLLSEQILQLLAYLEPFAVTTIRTIRRLVDAVYLVFTSSDTVLRDLSYSRPVYVAGRHAKQACSHVLGVLSASSTMDLPKTRSAVVLRTLLQKSQTFDGDPHQQVRQICELFTCLLPTPSDPVESTSKWVLSTLPVILGDLERLLCALDVDRKCKLVSLLITLDNGILDFRQWFISQELKHMSDLSRFIMEGQTEHVRLVAQQAVDWHIQTIERLMSPSSEHATLCVTTLSVIPRAGQAIADTMTALLSAHVYSESLLRLARLLSTNPVFADASVQLAVALTFIRGVSVSQIHTDVVEAFERAQAVLSAIDDADLALDRLLWEFGHCLSAVVERMDDLQPSDLQVILSTLSWLCEKLPGPSDLPGVSRDKWGKLCNAFGGKKEPDIDILKTVRGKLTPHPDSFSPTRIIPRTVCISIRDLETLLAPSAPVPSTPKRKLPARDILGLVALSPPTALLRSPAISGLTKMYTKNDFRELRQTPSARQNTSRLPSMHVDEFELGTSSPIIEPSVIGHPVETFLLGPPFNLAQ